MKKNLIILGLLLFVNPQFFGQTEKEEPKGKVTGEFFGDYYYKIQADTGSMLQGPGQYQQTDEKGNGFEIRRFNLGYEYTFNSTFSARLMLEGNDGFTIPAKDTRGVYIKYAYLQWSNIFEGSNLIFGAQSTPSFAIFTERIWSYRMVEKTILDYHKHAGSNDVGISLSGKIIGDVSYYLMAGNGKSASIENNHYKRFYGSVHGSLLDKKFLFQVYGDYERQSDEKYNYILKGFLGYQHDRYTVGFEPYNLVAMDEITNTRQMVLGITLFARGSFIDGKLNGFYRIDLYDDDLNSDSGYKETFMVFGVDYTPLKNISIIPNIWINGYNPEGTFI
ncbi:MAG TPA: hypothetical protein VJ346_10620, partial [Bacteroidales bacterium]|nr:hypothetical protein [Bacteroidales bacterium]